MMAGNADPGWVIEVMLDEARSVTGRASSEHDSLERDRRDMERLIEESDAPNEPVPPEFAELARMQGDHEDGAEALRKIAAYYPKMTRAEAALFGLRSPDQMTEDGVRKWAKAYARGGWRNDAEGGDQ